MTWWTKTLLGDILSTFNFHLNCLNNLQFHTSHFFLYFLKKNEWSQLPPNFVLSVDVILININHFPQLPNSQIIIYMVNMNSYVFFCFFSRIINEMDGTDFRFVKEVTKKWKKTFSLRDLSRTKRPPYVVILEDLSSNLSDLAMCNPWITAENYILYDFTTFYDAECSTFLVPKPRKLNEATSIYTALNTYVWLLFLSLFLLATISLNIISKIEKRLYRRESKYIHFPKVLLETIRVTLLQPAQFLSKSRLSLRILMTR